MRSVPLFAVVMVLPLVAVAGGSGVLGSGTMDAPEGLPGWLIALIGGTGLSTAASMLSAFFPSTNKVMKVVDWVAFNWLRARNDPNEN